jgi:hypothetical protein
VESKISFEVDLADLESVKERVPELERIVAEKRGAATTAAREYSQWSDLLKRLRLLIGEGADNESTKRGVGKSTSNLVVRVVEEAGGPVRAAEIHERLKGINPGTVGWAISNATNERRIKRVGYGVYAPMDWGPAQPQLPAGEQEEVFGN